MKTAKASELDRIVDEGEENILDYADLSTLRKPNQERTEHEVDACALLLTRSRSSCV